MAFLLSNHTPFIGPVYKTLQTELKVEIRHSQEEELQFSQILMNLGLVTNILVKFVYEYNLLLQKHLWPEYLPPDTVDVMETL